MPETHREGGRDAKGFIVVALRAGYATNGQAGLGPNMVEVKPNTDNTGYAIMYSHIVPEPRFIANKLGAEVAQFQVLGTIMDLNDEHFAAVRSCDDHLHLGYRKPAGGNYEDPGFLISQLGPEGLVNDPSPPCSGTPTPIP
ncbi:MAG TPA: hypothetical protein PLD25_32425 [Chloroflexota bacterium]|nr:hypothetical protein [Chloroflexota bacterium]HUM68128.1 hypothetical protein [Chloroflexota bacterium]